MSVAAFIITGSLGNENGAKNGYINCAIRRQIPTIFTESFIARHSIDSSFSASNIFNSHPWLASFWAFDNLISPLIGVAYFVAFWVWRGQTPGKMVAGIRVIRTDGSNITLGVAFLRCLGYIVSAAVIFIGFIWVAFDRHKQGFHDKIAETYVVKLPEPIPVAPEQAASA